MSNYLTQRQDWIFYNSIHSYSQLVLLPWGYTNTLPDDYQTMFELAQRGADALHNVHGKTYEVRAPLVDFGDLVSSCDYIVPMLPLLQSPSLFHSHGIRGEIIVHTLLPFLLHKEIL